MADGITTSYIKNVKWTDLSSEVQAWTDGKSLSNDDITDLFDDYGVNSAYITCVGSKEFHSDSNGHYIRMPAANGYIRIKVNTTGYWYTMKFKGTNGTVNIYNATTLDNEDFLIIANQKSGQPTYFDFYLDDVGLGFPIEFCYQWNGEKYLRNKKTGAPQITVANFKNNSYDYNESTPKLKEEELIKGTGVADLWLTEIRNGYYNYTSMPTEVAQDMNLIQNIEYQGYTQSTSTVLDEYSKYIIIRASNTYSYNNGSWNQSGLALSNLQIQPENTTLTYFEGYSDAGGSTINDILTHGRTNSSLSNLSLISFQTLNWEYNKMKSDGVTVEFIYSGIIKCPVVDAGKYSSGSYYDWFTRTGDDYTDEIEDTWERVASYTNFYTFAMEQQYVGDIYQITGNISIQRYILNPEAPTNAVISANSWCFTTLGGTPNWITSYHNNQFANADYLYLDIVKIPINIKFTNKDVSVSSSETTGLDNYDSYNPDRYSTGPKIFMYEDKQFGFAFQKFNNEIYTSETSRHTFSAYCGIDLNKIKTLSDYVGYVSSNYVYPSEANIATYSNSLSTWTSLQTRKVLGRVFLNYRLFTLYASANASNYIYFIFKLKTISD